MPESYQEEILARHLELVSQALARAGQLLDEAKDVVTTRTADELATAVLPPSPPPPPCPERIPPMPSPYPPIPPDPRDPASAELTSMSLPELLDATNALRGDVATAEEARARSDELRRKQLAQLRRDGAIMQMVLVCMAMLMALMVVGGFFAYQSVSLLKDCTTPAGACYASGQKRTGAAVGALQRIQLYIVECSRQYPVADYPPGPAFDRLFESCVADRLAKRSTAPLAPPLSPAPTRTP